MFEQFKAKRALAALNSDLKSLDEALASVGKIADPVDRIVQFFNVVAPWHDRAESLRTTAENIDPEKSQALKTMLVHFERAGRRLTGWNRTEPGQTVSADNVYLGNTHGRFTKTASHWQNSFKQDHPHAAEDREIIGRQAAGFVESHLSSLRNCIAKLQH